MLRSRRSRREESLAVREAAFGFTITGGKVVGIEILADPERLSQLDLAILGD